MSPAKRFILVVTALLACENSIADDRRAQVNYMLHCQGCHRPAAEGFAGRVPPMNDFIGYFLHSQAGREFLIRVPGVAHSALGDTEVTELMNWLLQKFSKDQLPAKFEPFTVTEVGELRRDAEQAPDTTRWSILADIAAARPELGIELGAKNSNK